MVRLKKSAETSYAEVNVLVDHFPVDCSSNAIKQTPVVLVLYNHGVDEPFQSFPSMTIQVATATELVVLMYIRLFLSATGAYAFSAIDTFLALRAVVSLGPRRRFDLFAPSTLDRRGSCSSSQAIEAKALAVCQEPPMPKSTANTTVGFGLLSVAFPTSPQAESDGPSYLVTAITLYLSSCFEIWLAQLLLLRPHFVFEQRSRIGKCQLQGFEASGHFTLDNFIRSTNRPLQIADGFRFI